MHVLGLDEGLPDVPALALQPEMKMVARVEFAYLQLRMICELFALACLAAQGDVPGAQTKAMRKAYADDDIIIKSLERLHPDFYPQPTRQAARKDGNGIWWNQPITDDFLTKSDLISLYGECGRVLHRGSLRQLTTERARPPEAAEAVGWARKLWNLLEHHEIQTIDPRVKLVGLMKDKDQERPQFFYWTLRPDGHWEFDGAVRVTG